MGFQLNIHEWLISSRLLYLQPNVKSDLNSQQNVSYPFLVIDSDKIPAWPPWWSPWSWPRPPLLSEARGACDPGPPLTRQWTGGGGCRGAWSTSLLRDYTFSSVSLYMTLNVSVDVLSKALSIIHKSVSHTLLRGHWHPLDGLRGLAHLPGAPGLRQAVPHLSDHILKIQY